jgi:hypothetical protein
VFGILTELLPNWVPGVNLTPEMWALYWIGIAVIIAAFVIFTLYTPAKKVDQS